MTSQGERGASVKISKKIVSVETCVQGVDGKCGTLIKLDFTQVGFSSLFVCGFVFVMYSNNYVESK